MNTKALLPYDLTPGATPGVDRGCGRRVEGGIYLESGLATKGEGAPLEWFLADPPIPFEPDHKIGIELVRRSTLCADGVTRDVAHVVDWVGSSHYPHAADFLEEVRRFGLSRRASSSTDFGALSTDSRILVVHGRAYAANADALGAAIGAADDISGEDGSRRHCRRYRFGNETRLSQVTIAGAEALVEARERDRLHLRKPGAACSRHLWMLAPPTHYAAAGGASAGARRKCASFDYRVFPPAPTADVLADAAAAGLPVAEAEAYADAYLARLPAPEWRPGIVASFPLSRVTVVRASDGSHRGTLDRLRGDLGHIPVGSEDE